MQHDLPPQCVYVAPIARAVKRLEWGSGPPRWNNPGALVSRSGGYRRYATLREGWIDACREIRRRLRLGATTARAFACGLPGRFGAYCTPARCREYARKLARLLGIGESDRLSRILPQPHF